MSESLLKTQVMKPSGNWRAWQNLQWLLEMNSVAGRGSGLPSLIFKVFTTLVKGHPESQLSVQ